MRAIKTIGIIFIIFLALVVGFTAGLFTDRQSVLPVTGMLFPFDKAAPTPVPGKLDANLLQEGYNLIQNHYADRQTLATTNLTYGALTGMVDSLGDTGHSRFLSPQMVAAENRQIQGEFEGIGALLNVNKDGNPVILAPMDNSPAQKAGLRPGDIILQVNGQDVSQSPLSDVVQKVLGPAGTSVTLTVRNPSDNKLRTVTIVRAKIVVQNITWQMLPGTTVAHIRIASFSNNVTGDLQKAIQAAQSMGAKGIILDMRNNPGGLLNEAVGVTSQFISSGNVMQAKDAQGKISSLPVEKNGIATDIPMVVLINEGTASAAEITAGALQDYSRAKLIGEKTFGTGTVLNEFRLSDGSAILLATELWLTPKGRVIWHQGITPDIVVPLDTNVQPSIPETERTMTAQDLQNSKDAQLLKALELLK
ncbi:MAG TPA: S41 family peptidase [Anaerolineaceae bacterium]